MNPLSALVLVAVLASASPVSFFTVVMEEWENFKHQHGKKYDNDDEEQFRMRVFAENKQKIAEHNRLYHAGVKGYKLVMNEYGDMLDDEYMKMKNGFLGNSIDTGYKATGASFVEPLDHVVLPQSIDWRELGAVTGVKNQRHCGSCWAFAATGALEGQHFLHTGKLVSLSEQNLIDCSRKFGNYGCDGGFMNQAFQYIKENGGIDTEESYPYEGTDGHDCRYVPDSSNVKDAGFVHIRTGSERALKKAIATVGPVSVAIDASEYSFKFYHHGVYSVPWCSSVHLTHAVLAVGYGITESGEDYWLIKNSWGKSWGDEGYFKLARNKYNMCGIATNASYPLV